MRAATRVVFDAVANVRERPDATSPNTSPKTTDSPASLNGLKANRARAITWN